MKLFKPTSLAISLSLALVSVVHANDDPNVVLDTLTVNVKGKTNISDQRVSHDVLKKRATTLGDALSDELGIHSNQFGGGASAPIIRGQEGKRLKILQNGADVIDMANLSPDHAITVDTPLARRVEIVRGVNTLKYSSGNSAGAVNVIDNKIPTQIPNQLTTETSVRFNTGNQEKLLTTQLTGPIGDNFVLHIEGLHKNADNYRTPRYRQEQFSSIDELKAYANVPYDLENLQADYDKWKKGELRYSNSVYDYVYTNSHAKYEAEKARLHEVKNSIKYKSFDKLPDSWADSKSASIGVSWVGDNGYLGGAFSHRHDEYGLPAHNHLYEGCGASYIFDKLYTHPYLAKYPQLSTDKDINYLNPRPDCHNEHKGHFHTGGGAPMIDLTTKRFDMRGEWQNTPWQAISKIRGDAAYVDYQHNEKEGSFATNVFKNKGVAARLEATLAPKPAFGGNLSGVWGVQHTNQKSSAKNPINEWREQPLLTENTTKNSSIFGIEKLDFDKVTLDFGTRVEHQKISMDYDLDFIEKTMKDRSHLKGDELEQATIEAKKATAPHKKTAVSYAGGVHWRFLPNHTLSLNVSHQERLPNAQELYTHGPHLATNSFEAGNRNLTKEKTNNYELSFKYQGDKFNYQLGSYLYDFDNYIYLETVNDHLGTEVVKHPQMLHINRYNQAPAKFYGIEGKIGYQFNDRYYGEIFGDYVKGRLHHLPDVVVGYEPNRWTGEETFNYKSQPDTYTPRLPPMRLGAKVLANFNDKWSGSLEYTHVFAQNKVPDRHHERNFKATQGHRLLNLGIDYHTYKNNLEYSVFLQGNNLLNDTIYAHETYIPYTPQMGRNFSIGASVKY
ncbi:TonB-dependent receptor [Moraxella nasovis]|uniref:TonB-dependent receptor n=1 Tax=Moraxella nasovis TaxID=2904121 RepID=UPI001F608E97|nr:TonB-dependent receptor [Moraxella nasovis]UNU73330.1 TonB-dependent receptor [Moraxella nasovis]